MAPRNGLAPLTLPRGTEETPEDDPSAPHSPLLTADTCIDFPQHNGGHDPDSAPPDPCPDPGGDPHSSRPGEGRFCRLQCVKRLRRRHLVLAAAGGLIVGGVFGFVAGYFSASPSPSCPNKWTRSGDRCFYISLGTNTWNNSLESCRSGGGGTLLTMDEETLQEIRSFHDLVGDYWVGLRKDTDSGKWRQLDGSHYTKPIEHDDPQMNCAYIGSEKYAALDCSSRRPWICVKSLRPD